MLWSLIYWLLRRLVARVARGADGQRDLEYVVLRYQIKLLSRQKSGRLQLRTSDRAVLAAAALFLPRERRSCFAGRPGHAAPLASAVRAPAPAAPSPEARQTTARPGDRCAGGTAGAREPALGLHADPRGVEEARDRGFRDDDRRAAASRRPRPRPAQDRSQLVAVPAGRGVRFARQGRNPG